MMIKERLANNWVIFEYKQECYTCENTSKIGKILFGDLFICNNCVEELGGE